MNGTMPKWHELLTPTLKALADEKEHFRYTIFTQVADSLHLPPALRTSKYEKSGSNRIEDRASWALSALKRAGLIEIITRGHYKITQPGKELLKKKIKLDERYLLDTYPQYKQHAQETKSKRQSRQALLEKNTQVNNFSPLDLIEKGFSEYEDNLRIELSEKLHQLNPYFFEQEVVLELFKKMNYGRYTPTSKSRDGGIDGIIYQDELEMEKIYIQAKCYHENHKVREPEIRNFIGAMSSNTNKGIFVTTSSFDQAAIKKASDASHKIVLIDGAKLVELLIKYKIGVQVQNEFQLKKIDEDFFS